jgi:hypothetical protein
MLAPPSRSHPAGRRRNPRLPPGRPRRGLRDYPFCNLADASPHPTQADLEQASGQVLRLYQDGGGKLRRHQEAQEQADIDYEVQTARSRCRGRRRRIGRMARTWTAEQREAQRRWCLETQPWKWSTGPTSEEGKLISSMNGLRHALYCQRNKIVRVLATWLLQAQIIDLPSFNRAAGAVHCAALSKS